MNSGGVEIDELISPSEDGETLNEVYFLLVGIVSYCWLSLFLVLLFMFFPVQLWHKVIKRRFF